MNYHADSPPTAQQLVVVRALTYLLGQRYAAPKTGREAMARIHDLAAQTGRTALQTVELPAGRSFGLRCPRCGSPAGRPCRDVRNGRPLVRAHAERSKTYTKQRQRARRADQAERRWAASWDGKGAKLKQSGD